ncbi:MAG: prephenate dehydratase domain-containing protein [Oceanicaulis sp.]
MTEPRLAFLGPEGSFSHAAAQKLAPEGAMLAAYADLEAVLAALDDGEAAFAVAALDSAAGPIAETQAVLASGTVEEIGRIALPVSFDLYRRAEDLGPLIGVYGHPKALSQIAGFVAREGLKTREAASNTAGLASVRDGAEPGWGAAGPPGLSQAFGLEVRARALESPARNETVFVLLRRAGAPPPA